MLCYLKFYEVICTAINKNAVLVYLHCKFCMHEIPTISYFKLTSNIGLKSFLFLSHHQVGTRSKYLDTLC